MSKNRSGECMPLQLKINNFNKVFKSWIGNPDFDVPKFEKGGMCPNCNINQRLIVNGTTMLCPGCEVIKHDNAVNELRQIKARARQEKKKQREPAPVKQYKG